MANSTRAKKRGQLEIPNKDLYRLAEKLGTPYYIIDERTLKEKLNDLRKAYSKFEGDVIIAYSIKANFNPFLLKVFIENGTWFDVTSPEELYFLKESGGDPSKVVYTSVTEGRGEYSTILKEGVEYVVVSSYQGLLHLIEASMEAKVNPKVMIRVHPEVHVKAEIKSSYGKFGVPFNGPSLDTATNLLRLIYSESSLNFVGFHFHLGSQIEDPKCFEHALEKLEKFVSRMKKEIPHLNVEILDVGGGIPVYYGMEVPSPTDIASKVVTRLNCLRRKLNMNFDLIVESGRYLSAEASFLVSRVINVKIYGRRKFVFLDTGYHQLLDSALVRQVYPVEVVPKGEKDGYKVVLVGRLCDDIDIFPLGPETELNGVEVGKLVVFKNVGAYSLVFNMPFHSQVKPAVVFRRENGEYVLARRRESLKELFLEEGGDLLRNFKKL